MDHLPDLHPEAVELRGLRFSLLAGARNRKTADPCANTSRVVDHAPCGPVEIAAPTIHKRLWSVGREKERGREGTPPMLIASNGQPKTNAAQRCATQFNKTEHNRTEHDKTDLHNTATTAQRNVKDHTLLNEQAAAVPIKQLIGMRLLQRGRGL